MILYKILFSKLEAIKGGEAIKTVQSDVMRDTPTSVTTEKYNIIAFIIFRQTDRPSSQASLAYGEYWEILESFCNCFKCHSDWSNLFYSIILETA